MTTKKWSRSI